MLRWLYPMTCALCGTPAADGLCRSCREGFAPLPRPLCLYCGAPVPGGAVTADRCEECSQYPRLYTFARSAVVLEGALRQLIHRYKYRGESYLAKPFAALLNEVWENTPLLMQSGDWIAVPVPIDKKRLYERGYNQSLLLAQELAALRGLTVETPLLRRIPAGAARSMTRMTANMRNRAADEAFEADPDFPADRLQRAYGIVLVDDVYTTGATSRACARALLSLPGIKRVGVLTIARVP